MAAKINRACFIIAGSSFISEDTYSSLCHMMHGVGVIKKQILFVFLPINLHPKLVTETQTKNIVFYLKLTVLSGFNSFA